MSDDQGKLRVSLFYFLLIDLYWSIVDSDVVEFTTAAKWSRTCTSHIAPTLSFRFFSLVGHYGLLSKASCAIQQSPAAVIHHIYSGVCISVRAPKLSLPPALDHQEFSYVCDSTSVL